MKKLIINKNQLFESLTSVIDASKNSINPSTDVATGKDVTYSDSTVKKSGKTLTGTTSTVTNSDITSAIKTGDTVTIKNDGLGTGTNLEEVVSKKKLEEMRLTNIKNNGIVTTKAGLKNMLNL